jgi:polyisoprenoid-binding protein YceI
MKKLNTLLVLLTLTATAFAQTYSVDKAHASVGFTVTHLLVSEVDGSFKSFDAKITASKDDFSDAVFELTADASSIFTNNDKRDEHLKSPDFFEVAKYPTVTFKSKSFKKVDGKNFKLTGDITMHGVTKSVELDVVFSGVQVHPFSKKNFAAVKISGVIKRSDFGIGPKTPAAVVSDEVTLSAKGEFIKD